MAERVLVTGGLGYLGSIVCEQLLDAGHPVTALDSLMYGSGEQGLYHEGTRYLSRFQLRMNGQRPLLLSARVKDDNELFGADLTNPDIPLGDGSSSSRPESSPTASFSDPSTGDPSIVIQPKAGKFVAFDAVCPHAGCTVGYDQSAAVLLCPCHGSQFNATTGAVEVGPAATGLKPITIAEGGNGQLYAT